MNKLLISFKELQGQVSALQGELDMIKFVNNLEKQ